MAGTNEIGSVEGQLVGLPLAGPETFSVRQLDYLKRALGVDETVLWSGTKEATTNNTVTVSESPNNFEYLRFEYRRNELAATNTVFRTANNGTTYGKISCSLGTVNIDSTQNNVYMFTGSFSGTTFTVKNYSTKSYVDSTFSTSTTSPMTLTKIVGIHRIQGGN